MMKVILKQLTNFVFLTIQRISFSIKSHNKRLQHYFTSVFEYPHQDILDDIIGLSSFLYSKPVQSKYLRRLQNKVSPSLFLCYTTKGALIGFKLGYAESEREYYSWLGGIHPDFRRLGIASTLMQMQHDWCKKQGFLSITTKSSPEFTPMISLNKKHGFIVVGEIVNESNKKRLLQRKQLDTI